VSIVQCVGLQYNPWLTAQLFMCESCSQAVNNGAAGFKRFIKICSDCRRSSTCIILFDEKCRRSCRLS